MKIWSVCLSTLFSITTFSQPVCTQTSVGYPPINDLGSGTWNTFQGGLYPNGSNYIPSAHKNAGMQLVSQIQPLDANGNPDAVNGKIVLLSIGMSNCTQEFSSFMPLGNSDPNKNPKVVLVDGAQGGQTAQVIWNPTVNFWNVIATRLQNAGVTANQVQAIWYKEANQAGSSPAPQTYADSIVAQSKRIMNVIKTKYPNAKICYVASRIYGGYASTTLNPEPYAYWTGWAKKWLIEAQINGDSQLQYSGPSPNSPWMAWGTYNWADGTTPRSDGLTWLCPADYQNDGTHPSATGAAKVANKLLAFLNTDSTACWYRTSGCGSLTGIQETSKSVFHIAGNPANDHFVVQLRDTEKPVSLYLQDIAGRTILSTELKGNEKGTYTVPCENLKAGIYFLKACTTSSFSIQKLVVAR